MISKIISFDTKAKTISALISLLVIGWFLLFVVPLQGGYDAPWLDERQINLDSITIEDCKPGTCPVKLSGESMRVALNADYGQLHLLQDETGKDYPVLLYPIEVENARNPYPEINAECRKYDMRSEAYGGCALVTDAVSIAVYVAGSQRAIKHEIEGHIVNGWVH